MLFVALFKKFIFFSSTFIYLIFPKSELKKFSAYFKITKHEEGSGLDYEVDIAKVEESRKSKGYFLIFNR